MMLEHGMRPTVATVNHLLSACAANKALEPAMRIFGSIKVLLLLLLLWLSLDSIPRNSSPPSAN